MTLQVGKEIVCGSCAAGFTSSMFSPLELVKTRLQVQSDPFWQKSMKNAIPYTGGFPATLKRIAAEDGITALWRYGWVGFVGRDFMYSGLRIGCYPTVRSFVAGQDTHKDDISLSARIAAASFSGAFSSWIANPIDVVLIRMTVESGRLDSVSGRLTTGMCKGEFPKYRNSLHCLVQIATKEGVQNGLWKGASATMARAALLSSGNLASYDHSKVMIRKQGWMEDGPSLHMACAIVSGIVATTVCNPADVVKSRLMSRGSSVSVFGVISEIMKIEGPRGFMRGWCPAYSRAGPTFFIQMPILEFLRNAFGVGSF